MKNNKDTIALKRKRIQLVCKDPSLTKQSLGDECNINKIMKRYEKTGIVEHVKEHPGQYGDFSEVGTYQQALNKIMQAQDTFDALPSNIRHHFENDPAKYVDFCQNPENQDQMVEMGLMNAPEPPPVPQEPPTPPPPVTPPPEE